MKKATHSKILKQNELEFFQRETLSMKRGHGIKQRRRLEIDKFACSTLSLQYSEVGCEFHSVLVFKLVILIFNHQPELVYRKSKVIVTPSKQLEQPR